MDRSTRSADWRSGAGRGEEKIASEMPTAPSPGPDGQFGLLAQHDDTDDRLARLARAIEGEIIPRLMLAHRTAQQCAEVEQASAPLDPRDVGAFTDLVMGAEEDDAMAFVQARLSRGVSVETVFLELLAPTARRLGDLWTEDRCDFTDVTLGLGRLQRVLREVSAGFAPAGTFGEPGESVDGVRRILLLPSPGEQHTFGLVMVSELFRRAGWEVVGGPWEAADEAETLVGNDWFDVVGFSLAAEMHVDALADCIAAVRQASRNGQVGVMVGGPIFRERPELAARLGADLTAADGRHAPMLAGRFLAQRRRHV
jgi:methanogenic corrinoid protein MtbC1